MLKTVSFEFNPLEDLWATRTGVSVYLKFRSDVMIDDGKNGDDHTVHGIPSDADVKMNVCRGEKSHMEIVFDSLDGRKSLFWSSFPRGGGERRGGPRPPPPTAAPDRLAYPTTLRHESLSRRACTVRTPR